MLQKAGCPPPIVDKRGPPVHPDFARCTKPNVQAQTERQNVHMLVHARVSRASDPILRSSSFGYTTLIPLCPARKKKTPLFVYNVGGAYPLLYIDHVQNTSFLIVTPWGEARRRGCSQNPLIRHPHNTPKTAVPGFLPQNNSSNYTFIEHLPLSLYSIQRSLCRNEMNSAGTATKKVRVEMLMHFDDECTKKTNTIPPGDI